MERCLKGCWRLNGGRCLGGKRHPQVELGIWTLGMTPLSELTRRSGSPFTTVDGSPWSQETQVLVPATFYKLCGKLFHRLQGCHFLPGHQSTAPVTTGSGAFIKPLLPLELLILIFSLQLLTPAYTPSAYKSFSTFRAARLPRSPFLLFPLLGMFCSPWQTLFSLSHLGSISLKLTLATPDRWKFFLFTSLCYYHFKSNFWFKELPHTNTNYLRKIVCVYWWCIICFFYDILIAWQRMFL